MLKPAFQHKDKINEIWASVITDEKNKYLQLRPYLNYEFSIDNSTWSELAFVSMDGSDVLGLLKAHVSREHSMIRELMIINFGEINYKFSKDFAEFLDSLFMQK